MSSKLKKAFEGRLPYMGMDVLAKIQILFAVADSMKEI